MFQQSEPVPSSGEQKRRPYQPPLLARVDLKSDEVLGIGCKLEAGGGGPLPPTCRTNPCSAAGS